MMQGITTHKRKISLLEAETTANRLIDDLAPLCKYEKCVVAGSVRRKMPEVGDIEIVCIPRVGPAKGPSEMFPIKQNLVIHYLTMQHHRNHGLAILKGGPRYHKILYGSTQVDIFMPNERQWGRILAMRTGPASYSKKMAARWVEMGYKGVNGKLKRRNDPIRGLTFPTERRFFAFLNWDYVEPENRGKQREHKPQRNGRKRR